MTSEFEYIDDDCLMDTGYGEYGASMRVEYDLLVSESGLDVKVVEADIQAFDNDGGELAYYGFEELEEDEVYRHTSREILISEALKQLTKETK